MTQRVLVVRTDSDGDVLLAGPAVRAVARHAEVALLVSPAGSQAARLLPGVGDVVVHAAPWSGVDPPPVDDRATRRLLREVAALKPDAAVVLTSFHQSPLPAALLLRLAGVPWIAGVSEDYPGSLLDLRLRPDPRDDRHEALRALDVVTAAGFTPDPEDDRALAVRRPLPDGTGIVPAGPYVVVHPGASVPARAPAPGRAAEHVAALVRSGRRVVVTGGPGERDLTAAVTRGARQRLSLVEAGRVGDLGGRTTFAALASVLDRAACVVVGNTGPAHLAAAVGTPVVSLFAPVVPAGRWAPHAVASVVLGDQRAACAGSRARTCPVDGHPCLDVPADDVVDAVDRLVARSTLHARLGEAV